MAHGRVPIGDGCVDKQTLTATAKSHRSSSRTAAYQNMLDEYELLQERNDALEQTNKKLNENNEILIEENSVNRALMLKFFEDLHKEPPADLMDRLANLEARRHQVSISSHAATHPLEMLSNANDIVTDDDDYDYNEMDDSNSYDDDSYEDDCGSEDSRDSRGSEDDMRGGEDDMRGSEDDTRGSEDEDRDSEADVSDN